MQNAGIAMTATQTQCVKNNQEVVSGSICLCSSVHICPQHVFLVNTFDTVKLPTVFCHLQRNVKPNTSGRKDSSP